MTANYYIKTYELSMQDTECFRIMIVNETQPTSEEYVSALAQRWIHEIRPLCSDEVECRAVMFRKLMDTSLTGRRPPGTTPMLAVAWAHAVTDAIQQSVCRLDFSANN